MSSTVDIIASPTLHKAGLSDSLWRRAARVAMRPLDSFAESLVIGFLGGLTRGQLRIITPATIYNFPTEEAKGKVHLGANEVVGDASDVHATITVRSDSFWLRVLTTSDLGFAEGYMIGEIDVDDLTALFMLFIYNRESLASVSSLKSCLSYIPTFGSRKLLDLTASLQTLNNAKANVSAHYDMSNRMFEAFLSSDMTYSCGLFEAVDEDLVECRKGSELLGLDPLERAQLRKLRHICNKADIRDGHRVLEIGTGWGSFSILAASIYKCTIDTVTLSEQQAALARERIAGAGLQDRIRVHVVDYRDLPPEWEGQFDRFVSIEMMEHVGAEYMDTYWGMVDWALKKNGAGVVQVSTLPDARMKVYAQDVDFIRKWIFPGGFLPSASMLLSTLNSGSEGRLVVESVGNIGPHYSRTLREWQHRFLTSFESVVVPELREQYDVSRVECETFKRKWNYYFSYCEAGFSTRTLGVHIISFTREGNVELGCDVHCDDEL
ncbi:cyclopropane-fatty-acyl-phospholipid synthase [Calocera viscosa TUFC12733]|uniref:Cyclopropane-fatty-acyl-phospholipid synthase n=1 Tax=Calocera viscosa (strain TUFC12733) TaxID=1330018 RepID=A0A167Q8Y7_CALVF|nr:cyclopropane-fatty-acyl-phospholipid synthase [Calocera viscosa TUFC12733]